MWLERSTIQRNLVRAVLLICGIVLLLSCTTILTYEYLTFRHTTIQQGKTLGHIIAATSSAALAFNAPDDAYEILSALMAEQSIVAAALYDKDGNLFSSYPSSLLPGDFPPAPQPDGYRFGDSGLVGFEPVMQIQKRRGTLYLRWDLEASLDRFRFYAASIVLIITSCFFAAAFTLSRTLRRQISEPIFALMETARAVSDHHDYSVRAKKIRQDEFGLLTDAFNQMLTRIEEQTAALSRSEARVRAVLYSALSAVVVIDAHGKVTEWNHRAETMFGISSSEALGEDLAGMIIPVRFRDAHRQGLARFLGTGQGVVLNRIMEMTALKRGGAEFPVELSIGTMEAGHATSFCGFLTDITERKEAEFKLQTQLRRMELLDHITRATAERQDLRSIFQVLIRSLEDNLPIDFGCVCLYDQTADLLTVASVGARSQALAAEVGLADETRISIDQNSLSSCVRGILVYEPDIGGAEFPFAKRLARAGLRSFVAAPLPVEGKIFGVLIAARRAPDGFSSPDCEFLRHVSEHVALAAHQVSLYGSLQKAYDDLHQTQQAAMQQERLRALGQMASGIAHDINNAISPVALYTEALLEGESNLSDRARRYLVTIQRSIDDVASTVLRMREFYRQREPQLELSSIDLCLIVQQVIDLTRPRWRDLAQERGVSIEVKLDLFAEPPHVIGIEGEVRDALTNLVLNAVDAMPDGGALVVRTRALNKHGAAGSIALEICDAGIGMDEETRRRCLEPFFTTKGERGTGLGLAMVYGMLQRHNGEIEIESTPGKGTTMRLIFPISVPAIPLSDSAPVEMAAAPVLRVLLVDDDPMIIQAMTDVLENDGHHVTPADGGEAGIEAFGISVTEGEPFGIVITDLGMPYVDGRRVAEAIKAASPSTPVILLTGWGQRLVDEDDIPPGVDRVLNKPPKLQDLRRALLDLTAIVAPSKP